MRSRQLARLGRARPLIVAVRDGRRRPRPRPTRPSQKLDEAEQQCIELLEQGKTHRRLPEGAEPDHARAPTSSSGGALLRHPAGRSCGKFAWPGLKKGMDGRTERIRAELDGPRRRSEAEAAPGRVPGAAGRRQERGRAHHRGGTARPPTRSRRDQEQRAQAELAEMRQRAAADIEAVEGSGHRRPAGRGGRAGHRRRRARRGAEPRSRDPDAADRELHQPGRIDQLTRPTGAPVDETSKEIGSMAEQSRTEQRITGYAEALFSVATREGTIERGRGRAVPLRPRARGQRRAARRAHRPAPPGRPAASRSSRTCWPARPSDITVGLVSLVVGNGRVRDLPAIVDRLARADRVASGDRHVAEVRSAIELTEDQKARLAAVAQGRPPARTSTSWSSSTPACSAASSPRSATPSSTAPCAIVSPNSVSRSKA